MHHKQSLKLLNQRLGDLKVTVTELHRHSVQLRKAAQYWERRCRKLSVIASAEAVVLGLFIIYVSLL